MHLCAAVARLPLSVARDLGHGMSGIWESLINESAQSRRRERTRLSHSSVALLGPGPAPRVSPQVGRGRMGFPLGALFPRHQEGRRAAAARGRRRAWRRLPECHGVSGCPPERQRLPGPPGLAPGPSALAQ